MSSSSNKRQVSLAVLIAGAVIVLFGVVLAAGHIIPAAPTQATSNHPVTTPVAGTPYPHAPGPVPTIGPLPTRSPSCPQTHFDVINPRSGTDKMAVNLDGQIPGVTALTGGFEDSWAIGIASGIFYYHMTGGEVEEPYAYRGYGFITVNLDYIDGCAANVAATPYPPVPNPEGKFYLTPGKDGAVIFTNISGSVISFKTTDGTSGSFNYVTGTFLP